MSPTSGAVRGAAPSPWPDRSTAALSTGTRSAGLIVALGYLTGLVGGSLVAAVGGLALVTFGRCLAMNRGEQAQACASLAVIAGALGVTGLRWGTLELAEIRSVQAVLGPTLLVGPELEAGATIVTALAAALALALWLASDPGHGVAGRAWTGAETAVAALALVTAFWGPKILTPGSAGGAETAVGALGWVVATGLVMMVALGGSLGIGSLGPRSRAALTVGCVGALLGAGLLVGATV